MNTLIQKTLSALLTISFIIGCSAKNKTLISGTKADQPVETVVLLHGLIRSSVAMERIADRLEKEGYAVHNLDYPGRESTIDEIVDEIHTKLETCCHSHAEKLHFVTHSMGGIVVRAYVDRYHPENLGRVVMLGPPNKGTELADKLKDNKLVGMVFGPVIQELGTGVESTPNRLGKADFEVGVITGDISWNPLASWMIPGPDDGTVSVKNAQLEGMTDFLVVPSTHTFIMLNSDVIEEVVYFLRNGQFSTKNSSKSGGNGNFNR